MFLKEFFTFCYQYPQAIWHRFWDYRHQRIRSTTPTTRRRIHSSLRTGLISCICLVGFIFCLNLIVGIWAAVTYDTEDGMTITLYQGRCNVASRANFWVHLLINILASSLFTSSSYVMQRLASPTREDLDRAHANHRALKIGTLEITNFALMSKKRFTIFILLWTSSLPIHLMYNSLVEFTTTNSEMYNYVQPITDALLPGPGVNATMQNAPLRTFQGIRNDSDYRYLAMWLVSQQPPLRRLEVVECLEAYSSGTSIDMGDVLPVIDAQITDMEYMGSLKTPSENRSWLVPWFWMCPYSSGNCDPKELIDTGTWMLNGYRVDHCLARQMPEQCRLNFNLGIMIAVLVCNGCKLLAMITMAFISTNQPLVTVGDAISSFLQREDATTRGLSIVKEEGFPSFWDGDSFKPATPKVKTRTTRINKVWSEVESAFFWSNAFGFILLAMTFSFFGWTYHQTKSAYNLNSAFTFSFSTIWQLGLGKVPPLISTLQSGFMTYSGSTSSNSYIIGACLANLPQLALSFLYLFYNNYYTRIFLAFEFRSFAIRRRGLRVSQPQEDSKQRSTYFLQFPLKWSLVMIAYFVILHTFLSESLFLRRSYAIWSQSFTDPNIVGTKLNSQIGFSPLGLFILSLLLLGLVGFSIGIGYIKRDWILPCVNGDSRSISAACHPPEGSDNSHLAAVRWGVISKGIDDIGHCSFSKMPVRPPDVGEKFL